MEDIPKLRNFDAGEILCISGEKGFLGSGSFGVVQCVFHRSIGWIAVKCFAVDGGMSTRDLVIKEFRNELSALQQANHENILRVYGWAQWERAIAVVTELMPAGSLRLILADNEVPLHPVLRLRMCEQVSNGIAFIHNFSDTKRLTHGDLKPENILLTKYLSCKIGDFGGARVAHYTGQTTTTDAFDLKQQMTLVYAAPERLRKLSCRPKKEQDTYSYGIIVHGVLSRETPTQYSASESKYLDGITRGERPDIEAIDEVEESLTTNKEKEIIQVLRSVMIRCWQDTPTDRPDMRDVRDQLHQLMSKQTSGDVMRRVGEALDKMTIFLPEQSGHLTLPLNCFNPQTRKFQDGEPKEVREIRNIESSNRPATIVSTNEVSSADTSNSSREGEVVSSSTASATTSLSAEPALHENYLAENVNQVKKLLPAATISSDAKVLPGTTSQSHGTKSIDPSTATARTFSATDVSSDDFSRPNYAIRGSESSTRFAKIASVKHLENHPQSSRKAEINRSISLASKFAKFFKKKQLPKSSDGKDLTGDNRRNPPRNESSLTSGRKPTLKEVFNSSDRFRLPEQVKEAPDLLERYKSCLANGETDEAKRLNKKLISIIKNEINTTGEELWAFADELRQKAKHLESIPFFVALASLHKKEGGKEGLKGMRWCVEEMLWANKGMVDDDVHMMRVVKDHVISLMRHVKDEMETMTSVDDITKCEKVVQALESIGKSEELIDELDVAMATYKEGLERVNKTFGDEAKKRKICGVLLEQLSDLYKTMSRFDDATSCYQQAIEVFKAATDVDEWSRKNWIESCERKMRNVQ